MEVREPNPEATAYEVRVRPGKIYSGQPFRRCGKDFGRDYRRVPVEELTLEQRRYLLNPPDDRLEVVEIVPRVAPSLEVVESSAPPAAKAEAPADGGRGRKK